MSLAYCPECSHEVSVNAVACPNCGRPMTPPVVEKKLSVVPVERRDNFPPWAIAAIVLLALILIALVYLMVRESGDEANTNVNVNVAGRRSQADNRDSRNTTVPSSDVGSVTVPGQTTTVPGTTTTVTAPADKGSVVISAKLAQDRGVPLPVRNSSFFLLEKSVESILEDAGVEPIEGNTLAASLGLSVVDPDRFGDFNREAMRVVSSSAKYNGTTDGSGNANLRDVAPGQYYIFGLTRAGSGFALWNSPVSIVPGENILNLTPQRVTEVNR